MKPGSGRSSRTGRCVIRSGTRQSLGKAVESLVEMVFSGPLKGRESIDAALRYLPVAGEIRSDRPENPSILEVGSGSKGITPYLPFPVVGTDVAFEGKIPAALTPVRLEVDSLPFPDLSFDYVLSVDMLEHVPRERRQAFVAEMLRVARRRVFIAVPCGEKAEAQDRELDALFTRLRGEPYVYLREHVERGLPSPEDMDGYIRNASATLGRPVRVDVRNNVNLKVRDFYMRVWIRLSLYPLYLVLSPILCAVRERLNSGDCYRRIFIVDLVPGGGMAASAECLRRDVPLPCNTYPSRSAS